MVDFRKMMLLMVVLVLSAGFASAQFLNTLQCVANAGVPPPVRAEGLAEEVGQVTITCTGGNPTTIGATIPTVNVQIFLSTNITSRLLSATASEAMLLIDEPGSIQNPVTQLLCGAPGNCPITAASSIGVGNYTGVAGRPNVWQAVKAGENSVVWLGVPVDPPGTSGNRVLRLTNVRADAASVGVSSTLIPSNIIMYITISGTGSLPLANNVLNVAYVAKGMDFEATGGNFNQCEPGTYDYSITYSEKFGTAFRNNNPNNAVPPTAQSAPGTIYNTESMWSNSTVVTSAGVATQGTRLIASFTNVPANIKLAVDNGATNSDGDIANIVASALSDGSGSSPSYTGLATGTTTVLASTGSVGSAYAVWEVIASNPGAISELTFNVYVTYLSSPLPGLGTASVAGNYAPVSTVNVMSQTAPVPRFRLDPQSATTFTINPCQTNLLFPYVTNYTGYDTGIAISNTTADPYSTPDQQGACEIYYYGWMENGSSAPATQTSTVVEPGKQLVFTLSLGNSTANIAATPGFTGYMIARCRFQYAHGYAFISDPGTKVFAQGYIALVLDQPLGNWTGTPPPATMKSL